MVRVRGIVHAAGVGQRVSRVQVVVLRAVQRFLPQAQQIAGEQRHRQVDDHDDGRALKIGVQRTDDALVDKEQVGDRDNAQHRGILDVDDEVVADLRDDVAQRLRQNNVQHRLPVVHADGLRTLGLAGVDGHDAAAHGLGHIRAGVDRHDEKACLPHAHLDAEHLQKAVVDEHGLHDHGCAAEQLHIAAQEDVQDLQQHALPHGVTLLVNGDGLQSAHRKADQAAEKRADQRQQQGRARAAQVREAVLLQHCGTVCEKVLHEILLYDSSASPTPRPLPRKTAGAGGQNYSLRGCTLMASSIMVL